MLEELDQEENSRLDFQCLTSCLAEGQQKQQQVHLKGLSIVIISRPMQSVTRSTKGLSVR